VAFGLCLTAVLSGCSAAGTTSARSVADDFYAALGRSDEAAACGLLAPGTRAELEDSAKKPCAQALSDEDLAVARVRRVDVYGQAAFVQLDADTAFLGRFPQGWRVSAAGCEQGCWARASRTSSRWVRCAGERAARVRPG
jgi:hypothetical protein